MTQQKQRVQTFGDPWVVKQDHWNTVTKVNNRLNPGKPRSRHKKFRPRPSNEWFLSRGHHRVWNPTNRRAMKEGSKVVNHDWINC